MKDDESLSDKIWETDSGAEVNHAKDIREAVKKDEDLINQFACGNITLSELKQERIKIFGPDLTMKGGEDYGD